MSSGDPKVYKLTVRPHRSEDGRYEYVVSSPGSDPLLSEASYPTYEAAKDAGDRHGQSLGLTPSPSAADG